LGASLQNNSARARSKYCQKVQGLCSGALPPTILELVKELITKRFGVDPIDDIQVLTPMHKGMVGAETSIWNFKIRLTRVQTVYPGGGKNFRISDKVMQVQNDCEKEVFNGDLGRIVRINLEAQEVVIDFDGKQVPYDYSDLEEVVPAYAISIHKSQGSEYPAVVVPILLQQLCPLAAQFDLYRGYQRQKTGGHGGFQKGAGDWNRK
jgi:exodeoxyribonuclease V alpha subunit